MPTPPSSILSCHPIGWHDEGDVGIQGSTQSKLDSLLNELENAEECDACNV